MARSLCHDYDNDGLLDLVVNHTGSHSQLFHNTPSGFVEMTNSAVNAASSEIFGGASWGDYDNDGRLDLFVSSYGLHSALYHNDGDGAFTRVTNGAIYQAAAKSTGGAWADYDNDGWLDLFVANDSGAQSFLYHNNGDGTFTAVTNEPVLNNLGTAQGAAWGDFDNNGFPDLVIPNARTYNNYLYRNAGNSNGWLTLKLEGRLSNRAAIGAKVRLQAVIAGRCFWQLREISGGGSLGSQNDLRASFGLGDATNVDVVRLEWPSGIVQDFHDLAPRQFLTLVEPEARVAPALLEVQAGESATFTVHTILSAPLAFQWWHDESELPGETNATLVIADTQARDAGRYTVTITQPGTRISFRTPPASLTGPVSITQPPQTTNAGRAQTRSSTWWPAVLPR